MTNEEYEIREKFADDYIAGWKGKIRIKGVFLTYSKENARVLCNNMDADDFANAKASIEIMVNSFYPKADREMDAYLAKNRQYNLGIKP